MTTNQRSKAQRVEQQAGRVSANYRLDVTDFGPIARANVEFRPLTVFVGPSNTGKSYLAVLVYALHRCLAGGTSRVGVFRRARSLWLSGLVDVENWNAGLLTNLRGWLREANERSKATSALTLTKQLRLALQRTPSPRDRLADEIRRCFGTDDLSALNRRRMSKAGAVVRFDGPPGSHQQLHWELALKPGQTRLSNLAFDLDLARLHANLRSFQEADVQSLDDFDLRHVVAQTVDDQLRALSGAAGRPAYYLPADRTGVMHSHQVVVGTLVQSATTAGLRPSTDVPMLSGVLADFLNELIAIGGDYPRRRRKDMSALATLLEHNLLQGAVRLRRNQANYPSFTYRPEDWDDDLPLMRTSSMVSELAPVVLYLRHVLAEGDVLIIEEPEAHLHPAMQTMLARELARLVRANVRIVLTTHSEWLLEQIANLVTLSALPPESRAGISGADVALSPDDVGAWFFKPCKRPRGSIVEEAKLNPQTGTFQTDYDDVSLSLYNDGAAIFNRRQALREQHAG